MTVLETPRLILRRMKEDDEANLRRTLQDEQAMYAYEGAFTDEEVRSWLHRQLQRYEEYGFGLWAIELKETGEFIGDCGLTIQNIDGEQLPDSGYHIHRDHWRRGYASEAGRAVRDWAFTHTDYPCLYSYMSSTNAGSYSTAASIGLKRIKEYVDNTHDLTYVYALTRQEWEQGV